MRLVFRHQDGKILNVDPDLWLCALDLAVLHGWRPRGMTAPAGGQGEGKDWDAFAYYAASGQEIATDDAREIARCLGAALPEVPDQVVPLQGLEFGHENTLALIKRAVRGEAPRDADVQAAMEILSGPPKQEARALIGFLESGSFTIQPPREPARKLP